MHGFDWGTFIQAFVLFLGSYFGTKHGNNGNSK
jgi:hypothetical protein